MNKLKTSSGKQASTLDTVKWTANNLPTLRKYMKGGNWTSRQPSSRQTSHLKASLSLRWSGVSMDRERKKLADLPVFLLAARDKQAGVFQPSSHTFACTSDVDKVLLLSTLWRGLVFMDVAGVYHFNPSVTNPHTDDKPIQHKPIWCTFTHTDNNAISINQYAPMTKPSGAGQAHTCWRYTIQIKDY